MKQNKYALLILFLFVPILLLAQGRSKTGVYYYRYDLPFKKMSFHDGRTYYDGTVRIWLDIEYYGFPCLYMDFKDSSNETITHELFLDEGPTKVFYRPSHTVELEHGGNGLMKRTYIIPWGNYRYLFSYHDNPGRPEFYAIEMMYATPGSVIMYRNKDSWSCILENSSDGAIIEQLFKELINRRAITFFVEE